jgi:hypothetical protein
MRIRINPEPWIYCSYTIISSFEKFKKQIDWIDILMSFKNISFFYLIIAFLQSTQDT